MIFQDIYEACDCVGNHDLIRIDTYPYLDKDIVKFDNYHTLKLTSMIDVVYNAVNIPFGYQRAIQEALVTKNFEWFNHIVKECYARYDTTSIPNYALLKYKDYVIGKLYGVTYYKEIFELITRSVF